MIPKPFPGWIYHPLCFGKLAQKGEDIIGLVAILHCFVEFAGIVIQSKKIIRACWSEKNNNLWILKVYRILNFKIYILFKNGVNIKVLRIKSLKTM